MNKSTKDIISIFGIFGVILFMIALIGFGPLLTVWSLNLLFNTAIILLISVMACYGMSSACNVWRSCDSTENNIQ